MKLQLIGCSHHHTRVEVREKLAFPADQVTPFLHSFYLAFPKSEAVLLSTCNRTELYASARDHRFLPNRDEMIELIAADRQVMAGDIANELFALEGNQAVEHLFSVAASLDSMVIGEPQILSQVKRAYQMANELHWSIPNTHQLFQAAIRTARRVASETEIHNHRVSVPSVAIGSVALRVFERLDNKRCLVLGAGEMAEETLGYLVTHGGRNVAVCNRTPAHADALARKFDGQSVPWNSLLDEIANADLVISTTGAESLVVNAADFESVYPLRKQRPLLILDLAIPRDFDPKIGEFLNVYLYTIDDLQQACERNRKARENQLPRARKILVEEAEKFMIQMRYRRGGSTIASLKRQADEIKEAELKRLWNRLESLDERQRQEIEYSFHRLTNKILHPPLESLKDESERGGAGLLEALRRLFQISDE